jgi:predicted alpha/beta superfamily hydrolase
MSEWLPYDQVHGASNTVTGTVLVYRSLTSPHLGRARHISVYLPPSLAAAQSLNGKGPETSRRYPVIYFHDGQNMFDERTSYVGEWHADETLDALAKEGIEAIAVAVPNAGNERMDEYSPWKGRSTPGRRMVGGKGNEYLEWLVEDVKPLIDKSFPTRTDRPGTGVLGSSLGGLISLFALAKFPETFGMVGAMSPTLRWHNYSITKLYEEQDIPNTRIHLDMGGREHRGLTDDARRMRDVLLAKGWVEGKDLNYVEDRYAHHHEDAWSRRLPDALRFLLADERAPAEGGPQEEADIDHADIADVVTA